MYATISLLGRDIKRHHHWLSHISLLLYYKIQLISKPSSQWHAMQDSASAYTKSSSNEWRFCTANKVPNLLQFSLSSSKHFVRQSYPLEETLFVDCGSLQNERHITEHHYELYLEKEELHARCGLGSWATLPESLIAIANLGWKYEQYSFHMS